MGRYVSRALAILIITALAGLTAFANNKSDHITFGDSFQFGGTTVKKGTYRVDFDETAGELVIKNGSKVVARAKAHAEALPQESGYTTFSMATENGAQVLRSVTYSGDKRTIVVGEATATTPK